MSTPDPLLQSQPFVYLSSTMSKLFPWYSDSSPSMSAFQDSEGVMLKWLRKGLCKEYTKHSYLPSRLFSYHEDSWPVNLLEVLGNWLFFCSGKQWLLHCSPNTDFPHSCSNTKQFLCSFSLFSGVSVSIPSSINLVSTFKVSRGAKKEHTGPRSHWASGQIGKYSPQQYRCFTISDVSIGLLKVRGW